MARRRFATATLGVVAIGTACTAEVSAQFGVTLVVVELVELDVDVSPGAGDADDETNEGEYRECVEKPVGYPPGREAQDEQQRRHGAHPEKAGPARRFASHRRPSAAS